MLAVIGSQRAQMLHRRHGAVERQRVVRVAGLDAQQSPAGRIGAQDGRFLEVDQQGRTVTTSQVLVKEAECGALGGLLHSRCR